MPDTAWKDVISPVRGMRSFLYRKEDGKVEGDVEFKDNGVYEARLFVRIQPIIGYFVTEDDAKKAVEKEYREQQ